MVILTFEGTIPSKKNSKLTGRNKYTGKTFFTSSEKYKDWQQANKGRIELQMVSHHIKTLPTAHITYQFWVGDERKFDLSNKIESINDLFVDVGLIPDDNWSILPMMLPLFMGIDKENPRCIVTVLTDGDDENIVINLLKKYYEDYSTR